MAETKRKSFDRRTADRYVEKGLVKRTELESYLKGLPDETANAQWVQMDLHEAEIAEDGGDLEDEDAESSEEEN